MTGESQPNAVERSDEVTLQGLGLHTGRPARLTLRRRPGPFAIAVEGRDEVELPRWRVVGTVRGMTLAAEGARRLATPDHLFAACGGLRVHSDLLVRVEGPEVPLLDGCATTFVDALRTLGFGERPHMRPLSIVREATVEARGSTYRFEPRGEASVAASVIRVDVEFGGAPIALDWTWDGDIDTFVASVAPARTFAFVQEVEALMARGLAKHVDPESVVVIDGETLHWAGREAARDEPVRHKVLDLIGDLFLYGGPPIGYLHATRPGHGSTHEAMRRALDEGIVEMRDVRE